MILTVTPNPSLDHVYFTDGLLLHDTNRAARVESDAGGKGVNAARVLAALRTPVLATGFLAGGNGAFVRRRLDAEGVRHDFVEAEGETRANVLVEDGTGMPPTTVAGPGPEVTGLEFEGLLERLARYLPDCSWCVLGGSLPQGVGPEAAAAIADGAKKAGCKVMVDADGPLLSAALEMGADLVKPNGAEAGRLLSRRVDTLGDAADAALQIRDRLAAKNPGAVAVVSVGSLGAAMAHPGGLVAGPAIPVEMHSTIGSGDSMVAGILHAMEVGEGPAGQLALGLAAGAATAMTDGSSIGSRDQIIELLPRASVEAR